MAQIVITIPNDKLARVLNGIAGSQGWEQSSGITKAEFAEQWVRGLVKDAVVGYEASQAARQAGATQRAISEQEISIT